MIKEPEISNNGSATLTNQGVCPIPVSINIQVISIFLFKYGIISFRAIPRVIEVLFKFLGFPVNNCHFTSVINWVIKFGAYKLSQTSFLSDAWTAIIDASIEWGNKKMLVVLGLQTSIMKNRSKALNFDDIEVVGVFVKETINSEVITNLLKPLFIKNGYPSQIVTDEGSDISKAIRLIINSATTRCIHTADIGHFAANVLKHVYIENEQFKQLLTFTSQIGSKLRQTVAGWIVPNKLRTKARFQGISKLAKWSQKAFEYCKNHLNDCEQKTRNLLMDNFQGYEFLAKFSKLFYQDCQVIDEVLKIVKNKGLSKETFIESMKILSTLQPTSEIRIQLEAYLTKNMKILNEQKIDTGILSTDIIESLFGKIKYILERSSTKDFNKLSLLLPGLVGEFNEELIINAIKKIKMKDIKKWEEENINETLLKKKRKEFAKLKLNNSVPKHAEYIMNAAA